MDATKRDHHIGGLLNEEPTEDNDSSDEVLASVKREPETEEPCGPALNSKLAKLVNKMFAKPLSLSGG